MIYDYITFISICLENFLMNDPSLPGLMNHVYCTLFLLTMRKVK